MKSQHFNSNMELTTYTVTLEGVADVPVFLNSTSGNTWNVDMSGTEPVVYTTFAQDDKLILDLVVQSGEARTKLPEDESESLTIVLDIPPTLHLVNTSVATLLGTNGVGNQEFEVSTQDIRSLELAKLQNATSEIALDARVIVREDDGNSIEQPFKIQIGIMS